MFVEFVSIISNILIKTFRKTSIQISNYDMYLSVSNAHIGMRVKYSYKYTLSTSKSVTGGT